VAFFDIQVNGYGGVDFNQDNLTAEDLGRACAHLRRDGVGGILATVITETGELMVQRIRRIVELRKADPLVRETIAGIHIEGPFINPNDGFRGAHPRDAIIPADPGIMERLLDAADGLTRIVTLAPEQDDGCVVTKMLAGRGITVSAGHTDASLGRLEEAIAAGLSMATHLGNGCPAMQPRHDNIIQRILFFRKHLWLSFIADGVHIPFPILRNYLDLIGPEEKCIVTTDAMAAAGLGPGTYRISRWTVAVGEDMAARSPDGSHLIGSAISMPRVLENLRTRLGLGAAAIQKLTYANPLASIGIGRGAPN
jgi:N-acetylglucosamine-6-phosphate deacetylase